MDGDNPDSSHLQGLKPIIEFFSSKEVDAYLHYQFLHVDTPEHQEMLSIATTDLFNLKEHIVGSDSLKHGGAAAIVKYVYQKLIDMKFEKLTTWMLTFLFDDKHNSRDSLGVKALSDITHNNDSFERENNVHEAVTYFHKWVDRYHPDQYLHHETWKRLSEILLDDELKTATDLNTIQVLRTKRLLSTRLQRFRIKRDTFPLFPEVEEDFAARVYQWKTNDSSFNWEAIEKFSFEELGPLDKVDRNERRLGRIQFIDWLKNLPSIPNPLKEFLLDLNELYNTYPNRQWGFPTYLRSVFTDMRWYGKYGPQSGSLSKVFWHLNIDQPEKFYIDSYVLIKMVRKFAVSAVEHADAHNIFIRMKCEEIRSGVPKSVILEIANDDHATPGIGWCCKTPSQVLGDKHFGNQMREIYRFYFHHCSDFLCYEVHQDSIGRKHFRCFDAQTPGTQKEQILIDGQSLWEMEDLKSINLSRIMSSGRGSFLRFIIPISFRPSVQSENSRQ